MFKKLLFFVALAAVGVGSYGIARALFSNSNDPAHSTATFTAGTISIDLTNHDGSTPFHLDNWMPGDKTWVAYDVKNNSTVPVTLSGHIDGTWGSVLGDHFVNVTDAEYWDGSWKTLAADSHGTFTYADASSPGLLIQLPAGSTVTMRMEASFDSAATNEYQGQTYTADIFVTATQVIPPAS